MCACNGFDFRNYKNIFFKKTERESKRERKQGEETRGPEWSKLGTDGRCSGVPGVPYHKYCFDYSSSRNESFISKEIKNYITELKKKKLKFLECLWFRSTIPSPAPHQPIGWLLKC